MKLKHVIIKNVMIHVYFFLRFLELSSSHFTEIISVTHQILRSLTISISKTWHWGPFLSDKKLIFKDCLHCLFEQECLIFNVATCPTTFVAKAY